MIDISIWIYIDKIYRIEMQNILNDEAKKSRQNPLTTS